MRKVKKALEIEGPKYLHLLVPCVPGWGIESELSVEIARLATQTYLFPVFEIEEGVITKVKKPKERKPVEDYLRPQRRFAHLFKAGGEPILEELREIAEENSRLEPGPAVLFGRT
jgi:pyruvate ferredoxin oxidoreductase beta subunit